MNGIKKMWYIYAMEYYLAIEKEQIGSFVEMCMDLESVIQSEASQRKTSLPLNSIHILAASPSTVVLEYDINK